VVADVARPPAAPPALDAPANVPPRTARTGPDEVLRRLDLAVSHKLDGLLHGEYQGLVPGHGSELGETRGYQPGDDVRRIDWNVTARMQDPHVRDTIADRELETWVVTDLGASMDFGTAWCEKRDLAISATAAIGFLTNRTGNRFGQVTARPEGIAVVPAKGGRTHLMSTLHRLTAQPRAGTGETDLAAAILRTTVLARRRGLAVVVSDFLGDPTEWSPALRRLATRHETIAVEVLDPRELTLPDVGVLAVVDPATGETREVPTAKRKLRERYAAAATEQRAAIAQGIRAAGADHLTLRTDQDWLLDVVRFVSSRRERVHARRAGWEAR
jgi:uncharacterized protein (DUF58 family)